MVHSEFKTFAIIALSGLIGVFLALIEQYLYTNSILIDELLTDTLVLREIQFITIMVWQIGGLIIAASQQ